MFQENSSYKTVKKYVNLYSFVRKMYSSRIMKNYFQKNHFWRALMRGECLQNWGSRRELSLPWFKEGEVLEGRWNVLILNRTKAKMYFYIKITDRNFASRAPFLTRSIREYWIYVETFCETENICQIYWISRCFSIETVQIMSKNEGTYA